MKKYLMILGVLLILLGFADVILSKFGIDITGVSWSPIAFIGVGGILSYIGELKK